MNKVFYKCDFEKNLECSKTECQIYCKATLEEEFAVRDEEGKPIILGELIEHKDGTTEFIEYSKNKKSECKNKILSNG